MTVKYKRAVLVALGAAALSACATATPAYPIRDAEAAQALQATGPLTGDAPSSATPPDSPDVGNGPTAPTTTEALPPINRPPTETAPAGSQTMSPPPEATPVQAPPAVHYIVEGRVVASPKPTYTTKVQAGDTVNLLASHYMATKQTIIAANKLKKPYELEVGAPLKIPSPKAYVVGSGDTLYSIGRRFGVPAGLLAELNEMDIAEHLRSGQKVALPVEYKDGGPIAVRAPVAPPRRPYRRIEAAPVSPQPYGGPSPEVTPTPPVRPPYRGGPPPMEAPPVASVPTLSDSEVAAAGRGRFAWPLQGDILSGYGAKPGGQRNDGLEIAAPLGTPIMAAAAGDVLVAGTQVPGYGTLVLVQHDGGWVTVYTHLSRTHVKIKDHVSQGDVIGEVGQSGGVDQPELHFEIRFRRTPKEKATPIDPALVLPPR
jgi:murein DD-endopeptidase MepM/ murein hydrolase activator NlpD